jgi:hypothetical protein
MRLSLRAAFLAGALIASSGAALAEARQSGGSARPGAEQSPRDCGQAKAQADAAEARARQAGASPNPELSLDVENFAGTGVFQGFRSTETTLAVSQRIELGGKRGAGFVAWCRARLLLPKSPPGRSRSRARHQVCPCRAARSGRPCGAGARKCSAGSRTRAHRPLAGRGRARSAAATARAEALLGRSCKRNRLGHLANCWPPAACWPT